MIFCNFSLWEVLFQWFLYFLVLTFRIKHLLFTMKIFASTIHLLWDLHIHSNQVSIMKVIYAFLIRLYKFPPLLAFNLKSLLQKFCLCSLAGTLNALKALKCILKYFVVLIEDFKIQYHLKNNFKLYEFLLFWSVQ